VVDAGGKTWQVHDVRETTVAIMLFTVFFSALLAALHLARERADREVTRPVKSLRRSQ
jgi:hypothetical protein